MEFWRAGRLENCCRTMETIIHHNRILYLRHNTKIFPSMYSFQKFISVLVRKHVQQFILIWSTTFWQHRNIFWWNLKIFCNSTTTKKSRTLRNLLERNVSLSTEYIFIQLCSNDAKLSGNLVLFQLNDEGFHFRFSAFFSYEKQTRYSEH